MERLRIEFARESLDARFVDHLRAACEALTDLEVVQVQAFGELGCCCHDDLRFRETQELGPVIRRDRSRPCITTVRAPASLRRDLHDDSDYPMLRQWSARASATCRVPSPAASSG